MNFAPNIQDVDFEDSGNAIYEVSIVCIREDLSSGETKIKFQKTLLQTGDVKSLIILWPHFHNAAKSVAQAYLIGNWKK